MPLNFKCFYCNPAILTIQDNTVHTTRDRNRTPVPPPYGALSRTADTSLLFSAADAVAVGVGMATLDPLAGVGTLGALTTLEPVGKLQPRDALGGALGRLPACTAADTTALRTAGAGALTEAATEAATAVGTTERCWPAAAVGKAVFIAAAGSGMVRATAIAAVAVGGWALAASAFSLVTTRDG